MPAFSMNEAYISSLNLCENISAASIGPHLTYTTERYDEAASMLFFIFYIIIFRTALFSLLVFRSLSPCPVSMAAASFRMQICLFLFIRTIFINSKGLKMLCFVHILADWSTFVCLKRVSLRCD